MTRTGTQRLLRLAVICLLAAACMPFEPPTAEAGRIKFRSRSSDSNRAVEPRSHERKASKDDSADVDGDGPTTIYRPRSRLRFGSRGYAPAEDEEGRAKAKPAGAAAAAAERARAALAAEQRRQNPAAAVEPLPVSGGKTTSYDNGIVCVAGC